MYAIALDGTIDLDLVRLAEKLGISNLIGTASKVKDTQKVTVLTEDRL